MLEDLKKKKNLINNFDIFKTTYPNPIHTTECSHHRDYTVSIQSLQRQHPINLE